MKPRIIARHEIDAQTIEHRRLCLDRPVRTFTTRDVIVQVGFDLDDEDAALADLATSVREVQAQIRAAAQQAYDAPRAEGDET